MFRLLRSVSRVPARRPRRRPRHRPTTRGLHRRTRRSFHRQPLPLLPGQGQHCRGTRRGLARGPDEHVLAVRPAQSDRLLHRAGDRHVRGGFPPHTGVPPGLLRRAAASSSGNSGRATTISQTCSMTCSPPGTACPRTGSPPGASSRCGSLTTWSASRSATNPMATAAFSARRRR